MGPAGAWDAQADRMVHVLSSIRVSKALTLWQSVISRKEKVRSILSKENIPLPPNTPREVELDEHQVEFLSRLCKRMVTVQV